MNEIETARTKYFPMNLQQGYRVEIASREQLDIFMKEAFGKVFTSASELRYQISEAHRAEMKRLRDRYSVLHHEQFLIFDSENNPVGWFTGEAEDGVTFYLRNSGMLPEHQSKGAYAEFGIRFLKYLEELGYERVSSQHKVTNRRVLIAMLKNNFVIVGLELTENWGPLVKLVKHLRNDRSESFHRQFGAMEHMD